MGLHWRRRSTCERSARALSLRLDGELSELEEAALERHLAECEGCRSLELEQTGFTRLLRAAPLVELGRPIAVDSPSRGRVARHLAAVAAALGMLAAVGAGSLVISGPPGDEGDQQGSLVFTSAKEQLSYALMQQLRVEPREIVDAAQTPAPVVHRVLL